MTEKEIDKYQAPQAFHEHTEEYDSWFEDSLVSEIEVTALRSLHVEMDDPKMEIGVGPGRFAKTMGGFLWYRPSLGTAQACFPKGDRVLSGIWRAAACKRQDNWYDIYTLYPVFCG